MAAPLLAGLVADAAQEAGHPLGVLGPALYQVHGPCDGIDDITTGTGTIPGIAGYPARPGYDLPAGIGTVSSALRFTTALACLAGRPAPQAAGSPRKATVRTR
jgi:subtilase family serine protease